MVRILVDQKFEGDKHYIEATGLSTDTKPTDSIITGSVFVEVDTTKAYFFDEESGEWKEAQ